MGDSRIVSTQPHVILRHVFVQSDRVGMIRPEHFFPDGEGLQTGVVDDGIAWPQHEALVAGHDINYTA
jgi:hypothetical protein